MVDRWRSIKIQTKAEAFTLVEMLVVAAIIVVLAGILLSVLARSREAPKRAICASNLHQLYLAFEMYATDHDRYLPPYVNRAIGMATPDGQTVFLPDRAKDLVAALAPYARSRAIWFCPSDPWAGVKAPPNSAPIGLMIDHFYTSYGINENVGAVWAGGSMMDIDGKVRLPVGGESDLSPMALLSDNLWGPGVIGRDLGYMYSHNGVYNYLRFDGRVEALPASSPVSI